MSSDFEAFRFWLTVFVCCLKWNSVDSQLQAAGATCVGDAAGNTGTCMENDQLETGCRLLGPSWGVGQGNCQPGLQCCFFIFSTFTPSPPQFTTQPPFFPTTWLPPYLTTPNYPTFYPTPPTFYPTAPTYPPIWPTQFPPIVPTLPPPGGRLCGRLRTSDFDGIKVEASAQVSSVSLPEGFKMLASRQNGNTSKPSSNRVKRIVGGEPVADGDLCYQVVILSGNLVISTGALISEDYVITSYSAIARTDATGRSLRVVVGGYANVNMLLTNIPGFRVLRVIAAPGYQLNYGPGFPINDVALLQIDRAGGSIDWTRVCIACLPRLNVPKDCRRHFVSGYGSTSEASTTSDGILRRVDISPIPIAVCQNAYRLVFPRQFQFDPNSMCAGGEGGRDTCNRDGGAPLVCETFGYGDRYLEGISSWGYGCGRPGFPGVYTNVANLLPWIQQFVRQ